jgi:hypothetical protein
MSMMASCRGNGMSLVLNVMLLGPAPMEVVRLMLEFAAATEAEVVAWIGAEVGGMADEVACLDGG